MRDARGARLLGVFTPLCRRARKGALHLFCSAKGGLWPTAETPAGPLDGRFLGEHLSAAAAELGGRPRSAAAPGPGLQAQGEYTIQVSVTTTSAAEYQ
jgi:hypothetical protein